MASKKTPEPEYLHWDFEATSKFVVPAGSYYTISPHTTTTVTIPAAGSNPVQQIHLERRMTELENAIQEAITDLLGSAISLEEALIREGPDGEEWAHRINTAIDRLNDALSEGSKAKKAFAVADRDEAAKILDDAGVEPAVIARTMGRLINANVASMQETVRYMVKHPYLFPELWDKTK